LLQILLIVCLLIVYGSLYPFQFHHTVLPASPLWMLLRNWPDHLDRYVLRDIAVNTAIYTPLGMFGFLAFIGNRPGRAGRAVIGTLLLATGLSASMEMIQLFDDSRVCGLSDLVTNIAGAGIGVAFGFLYRESLRRIVTSREAEQFVHVSGPMLLLYGWVAYQVFPLFPSLSRTHLAGQISMLLSDSFNPIDFFGALVGWLAAARLLESLLCARKVPLAMLILLAAVPFRMIVATRNLTLSEAMGAAAAWLVWYFWLARLPQRTYILATAFFVFLVVEALAPFHLDASPKPFSWIPFAAALSADWIPVLTTVLLKGFWYGAMIWLGREAWGSFLPVTIALTAVLAATETAQRWLPGRTPEITDPIMAVLLAAVLWLAERHHRDAAFAISGTERSARAAP
jgi:VanZ family protein